MALVVEDGTGKTNADAYVDATFVDSYADNFAEEADNTAWDGVAGTPERERAIRRATQYLDNTYKLRWKGRRDGRDQALDWPRVQVVTSDGFGLDSNVVPLAVQRACAEIAMRSIAEEVEPDADNSGSVKLQRDHVGPLETETEYSNPVSNAAKKSYEKVENLLSDYIEGKGNFGTLERG